MPRVTAGWSVHSPGPPPRWAPTGSSSRWPRTPRPPCATGRSSYTRATSPTSRPTSPPTPGWSASDWRETRKSDTLRYVNATGLPPGLTAPRAVQTVRWLVRPWAMMEELHRRHGDMFTVQIANEGTWVFLAHPDAVKQVFTGDPRLLHAGEANRILLPLLGHHSVLLLDDEAHMRQRKLMLPPFHGERMRRYEEVMAEAASEEIEGWPLGEPQAVREATQRITLEVIMRTVFGVQDESRRARLMAILGHVLEWGGDPKRMALLAVLGPRNAASSRMFRSVRAPADQLIYQEIRERRRARDLGDRDDVLSMLLTARHEDGNPMSDEELRDELMTLLVAGHETTASSLAWAVERL